MKSADFHQLINKFDCFSSLSQKETDILNQFAYWRTYQKGQILFTEGDPRERIYFLTEGYVKLQKENESATLSYANIVPFHKMFPFEGLFQGEKYIHSAKAATDIQLFYIPTNVFEDLIRHNQKQLIQIIQCFSEILELHEDRLQLVTNAPAQDRVIHTIRYLLESIGEELNEGVKIHCPLTSTEIAEMSGTSRKTVSDVIKQLKDEGILTIDQKNIFIYKPHYFTKAAQ